MSRLTDLIAESKAKNPQLGADLEREFRALSSRLPFGLNFERHRPEAVELPLRPVRKGDKVRVLPERGSTKKGDQRLWQVVAIHKKGATRVADLRLLNAENFESQSVSLEDVVVVAEFKDTIYPGLVSTGKVLRGADRPYHTVINGENFHALKALTWSHRGKVDAIYIDPPYNTGARDWKYNNDYVEGDDLYRHSKWLAFMERRLAVAKELLNPDEAVLIATIDEKEVHRLALLLDQMFPDARVQMVSTVINPKGTSRAAEFSRTDEHLFFVMFGKAAPSSEPDTESGPGARVEWGTLRRRDLSSVRRTRPAQFYPIYVEIATGKILEIGDALPHSVDRMSVPARPGCETVFPVRPDGTEMNWGVTAPALRSRLARGYVRIGKHEPNAPQRFVVLYLKSGPIRDIESGKARVIGRGKVNGDVEAVYEGVRSKLPTTNWHRPSHNAERGGSVLLRTLLPERHFPFPKSLHAVEDALRFFVADKPYAVVLDFFAGSGTTAHAVMRLNRQDGGSRQCISVTNNEVAADEQAKLRKEGLRPGDVDWERWGICDYITKPRIAAAITGKTPDGEPLKGDYKFADEFPMSEGFTENAEFFTLSYETPVAVSHNVAFSRIAPLLWMRAGSQGQRINSVPEQGWAVVEAYGLLTEPDQTTPFLKAVRKAKDLRIAFIVTDDDRRFQAVARRLPDGVEPVRLYESYLTNFAFSNGGEE